MVKVCCSIKGCRSKSFANGEISFCALPTKPELRKKWLKIINRPDWTPHKYSTVCSKHFEPKCFVQRGRRMVLIKDSIPTLFVPIKLKQRTATLYISPMVQTQSSVNSLDKKFYQNTIQQLRSNLQTRQNLMTARKQQAYEVLRMVQPSVPVNKDSKGKILACRACLTTDARFAFLGNSMMQAFQDLVGTPFASTDVDLPQYFCALCRTELSKFVAFRDRCQRASELLQTLNEFEALTSEDISAIDRDLYKLTHNLNKVEVFHYNSNEVHYFSPIRIKIEDEEPALEFIDKNSELETLEDYNECEHLEILEEKFNDIDDERETFDTDSNDNENEAEVEYLDDTEDEKEEILEESFIYIEDGEQEGWEDFNDTGDKIMEKFNVVFNDDELEENETLDEGEEIEENKLEYLEMEFSDDASIYKNIYSIIEQTENIADVEKSPHPQSTKRKVCKTEVDYPNFDCAAFEKRYQVKITVLDKEEQLKEIEDRKKESSYLNAAYKCEFCGKGFKTEKPFRNHMTYHDQRTGRFLCEICHFRFPVHRRLLQHRKMHRVKYTCLQCGFVSRGRAFATRHREFHLGKKYSCMHCLRSFTRRSTCYNHARIYHARDNIACDQCGETFLSMRGVRLHKSRAHREKLEPKAEFKCPICQVNFETSKARDNHESSASIVKHMTLSPCAVCGENCETAAALNEHTASKHSPDQFRCEECDKTFSNAASFDTHTVRKHREPVRRRARTASPRRTKVCCEICGLFVTNEAVLRQHQITHAADKPFKCPFCSRGFAVKHARNFHIRTHTGERPFQCEQCPLAFALHSNLQRHHRVVHLGQRRSFPCELCGKTFTTRYSVKLHVNTVHNGLPWPKRDRRKKTKK